MRSKLTLLFCLALLALTTAITEPWPDTDRKTWPIGGEAACTDAFCDCPVAASALLCEDFEEGGESDCSKVAASGIVADRDNPPGLLGELGYVSGVAPDCADATSPLDGTYSFEAVKAGGGSSMAWWPDDTSGGEDICASNESCIATAYLNIPSITDSSSVGTVMGMHRDGGDEACTIKFRGDNMMLRPVCDSGSETGYAISSGVTYKVCLEYVSDACTLKIDAEGGTWCAGATSSDTHVDCFGGAHEEVHFFTFGDADDLATVNLDDILIVTE